MRITTKGRYGVRAVLNLASSCHNRPVTISKIAEEEEISPEFLEQIFFKLKKAGIIRSLRGPGGGFVLNRKISEITIKDLLDAVGENIYPTPCTERSGDKGCPRSSRCSLPQIWSRLSDRIEGFLTELTLNDIINETGKKYSDEISPGQDFSI